MKLANKDLVILGFIIALLTSMVYVYTLPTAFAAELNVQDKTISVLNDVMGLKTDLYAINQSAQRDSQHISLAQEEANVYLSSSQSKLRVSCSFVNNQLHEIYLSDQEGSLALKQSAANSVEMAKSFLERFQNYTRDSFYGSLSAILNDTNGNLNITKPSDNIQLRVTTTDQNNSDYIWTYIDANGTRADRKNIVLSYEGGQLKGFLNNWPLYKISGTPKISAKEATAIAIEASKNFSYQVISENGTLETVTEFKIAPESLGHESIAYLNYNNEIDARGRDPFTLYPAWYVPIGFDKFYPGDVSSMAVIIWADTGEVSAMQELVVDSGLARSSMDETINSQEISNGFSQQLLIPIAIFSGLLFGVIKSTSSRGKIAYRRFWGILICISILFSALLVVSSPSVSASTPAHNSKSRIYSCEGTEDGYNNDDADTQEESATAEVCNYIGNLTEDYGYDTTNLHGSGTVYGDVYDNAYSDEQNYDRTTVFHAGHFSSLGRSYQDCNGRPIRDINLTAETGLGEHFFTFLWICVQAHNPVVDGTVRCYDTILPSEDPGTPIGWTHRDGSDNHPFMSSDGYARPDSYGQCYISFYGYSPMLSGLPINTFFEQTGVTNCKEFIKKFYDYALTDGLSVHDALDQASSDYFGVYYSSSLLSTGYNAYWPGGDNQPPLNKTGYYPKDFFPEEPLNQMRVYGDASIHLVPQTETISVDYFSGTYDVWNEVGASPYLQEGVSNFIYESGNDTGDAEAFFYFSNPTNGQGKIESVKLKLFCGQTDPQSRMQFNASVAQAKNTTLTSSSYVFYQNYIVTPQYGPYYGDGAWEDIDITSWVNSWETLDNVRLKFVYRSYYGSYEVKVYTAQIEITYWPTVGCERDIVIFGNETSYPWLGDWADMLYNFGYNYAIVDPSQVSHGIISKAHALIVAPNIVNELPGRFNLWGASLIQEASVDIPVLCHMFSYTSQVYRQDDTNYGDGWGPLQASYKHSNATSVKDPSGADMQNITFNMDWSYFPNGAVVPFYSDADGYLRTVNSNSAYWNSYASHTIVAKEYGSQNYAAIVHGDFYGGEGILAVDLEAIFSNDWNCRNLIFYPWLDKVDFEIGYDKCPTSNYLKHWYANGYEFISFSDIQNAITSIDNNDDGEVSTFSLGTSVQGRDITALQIGSGSEVVLIVAGIHGNEKAAVAGALNLAHVFDNLYQTAPNWKHILDNHIRIVLVPCNNPDGYVSNTRENANGVDVNRNYDYGSDTPFNQPETRAISNFVGNNTIKAYVGFHMGEAQVYLVEATTTGINRHDYPYRDQAYMLGYRTNETLVNEAKIFHGFYIRLQGVGDSQTLMGQAFNGTQALHVMLNEDCPAVTFETLPGFDGNDPSKSSARLMGTSIIQITVVGMELSHWRYETLVPWGEGAYLEFSYLSGGTSHYLKVDDNTDVGDGDSTWVGSNSYNIERDTYSVPSLSGYSSGMSIGKVAVYVVARGTTGPSIVLPALQTQSTFYSGTDQNIVITYSRVNYTWPVNPNTGAAWTNSDIDSLQVGQKADHAALRVTEVYAVIEYDQLHS